MEENKIWAPWRMELIRQPPAQGCFFCDYVGEDNDENNLILERGENCFVIFNRYPYNNGHLMVVPYAHVSNLSDLTSDIRSELMEYTTRWQAVLAKVIHAQGFNIGINLGSVAGAGVKDHIHIHIVPRWQGDTNFMPVIADTKVISQSLNELYLELKKEITM